MEAASQAVAAVPAVPAAAPVAARRRSPALWVPSLYFAMGTPMTAVTVMSAVMYKNLGLSNAEIALYTGSMYLPWVIKPLWSPVVEMFRTKRFFVLAMELVMTVTFAGGALALGLPHWLTGTIALFWLTGFASATQDIAADGVYISSMSHREQAAYVGIQGIFWNLGRIIATGLLVSLTGVLHGRMGLSWAQAWTLIMGALAVVMALSWMWHLRVLPTGGVAASAPQGLGDAVRTFKSAFATFFAKKMIWRMIAVYSRVRANGLPNGTPCKPSITCGPDGPMPSRNRLPDNACNVIAVIAAQVGVRAGICMMLVPALIRVVRASTQATGLTASVP